MYVNVNEAEEKLYELIQLLVDGKEESIIIVKNGKPVAKMSPILSKNPKRIGAQKKKCLALIYRWKILIQYLYVFWYLEELTYIDNGAGFYLPM